MAAELIDKLGRFQVSLLGEEYSGRNKTIPKDAIESIVESFGDELIMRVLLVSSTYIGANRYNINKGDWEEGPVMPIRRHDEPTIIGAKTLKNGHIAILYEGCRLTIIDPSKPYDGGSNEYLGQRADDDPHHLDTDYDERPDLYGVVSIGPDRVAIFDNILRHNYIETDLSTGKIYTYNVGGQYDEDEDEGEEDLPENGGYRRFAHAYHDFYDIGFGRCLLVADAEDDMPRAYIVLDVQTGILRTIPSPFPGRDAVYDDYYVGMSDGSIFTVGGTVFEGNHYEPSARCSKFDIVSGAWTPLADAPIPIAISATLRLPTGDIMVVTGPQTGDKMLMYNPASNTWKMTESRFSEVSSVLRLVVV
jgi:hypothetical protein